MLPGFRFLFGAIVLSISVLVFGFGAAALLRTAHEEFASAPAWRPAPETHFAQAPETQPVLAMLRVDDAPADAPKSPARDAPKVETLTPADVAPKAAADPAPALQPYLDKTAALQPADTASPETAKVGAETAVNPVAANPAVTNAPAENPTQTDATTAPAETPLVAEQTKVASIEQPATEAPTPVPTGTAPASEAAPAEAAVVTEAASVAPAPVSALAPASFSTKIATLGGPPVEIARPKGAKAKSEKDNETAKDKNDGGVKKRQAHRAAHRRRLARRAALLRQQAAQQQLNPFGQPTNPAQ